MNNDMQNGLQNILDAMNNFVFHDDNAVSKITVEKRYSLEDKTYIKVYEY